MEDLGNISQTSLKLRDAVLAFMESGEFSKKMADTLMEPGSDSLRDVYRQVGVVLKRATCIMPTPKRLKVAEQFYALVRGQNFFAVF